MFDYLNKHFNKLWRYWGSPEPNTINDDYLDGFEGVKDHYQELSSLEKLLSMDLITLIWKKRLSFLNNGKHDGARAINFYEIKDIAEAACRSISDKVRFLCHARIKSLETEVKALKNRYADKFNELVEKKQRINITLWQAHYHPTRFSVFRGALFTSVGLLIILAEFALALQTSQNGFNLLRPAEESLAITQLFSENFIKVFLANWETMCLALGIALIPFIIKIFYDEYFEQDLPLPDRIQNAIWQQQSSIYETEDDDALLGISKKMFESPTIEDEKEIGKKRRAVMIVDFIALTLVFGVVTLLGYFRYVVTTFPPKDPHYKTVTMLTFIALAIAFPLISGISLSKGISSLQRFLKKTTAKRIYDWQVWRLRNLANLIDRAQADLSRVIEIKGEWNNYDTSPAKWYEKFFIAHYIRGYQLGKTSSDEVLGKANLFDIARELQKKLTANRSFSAVAGFEERKSFAQLKIDKHEE